MSWSRRVRSQQEAKRGNGSDQPSDLPNGFSEGQAVCSPPPSELRRFPQPKAPDPNRKEGEEHLGSEDKIVRPYKKDEREERQNFVNEDESQGREGGAPERIGETLKGIRARISRASPAYPVTTKREYLARHILAVLRDRHSSRILPEGRRADGTLADLRSPQCR